RYHFSHTINHDEDGYHFYHIKAVDHAGNETEIGRRFFLDSKKAKLKVKRKGPKKVDTDTVQVEPKITDNFDKIDMYVNGYHVSIHELSRPYGMHGLDETMKTDPALEGGENTSVFEVVDLRGHVTTE